VYLHPLLDYLHCGQNRMLRVWDEHKREHFNLRAMLFITIQDEFALSTISGQVSKATMDVCGA
jgi:hypothetical protein